MAKDKYANKIVVKCTQASLDTLAFASFNLGISAFDRVGLILHKIGWSLDDTGWAELVAASDNIEGAIVTSDQVATITADLRQIVAKHDWIAGLVGVGANFRVDEQPKWDDFTGLPGKGMLVPPSPLYLAVMTAGNASVRTVYANIWFSIVELADADYFELLETTRYQQ